MIFFIIVAFCCSIVSQLPFVLAYGCRKSVRGRGASALF